MNAGSAELPGSPEFAAFNSESGAAVVFEADGETQYLYAVGVGGSIEESVFIGPAHASAATLSSRPSVVWSANQQAAKVQVASTVVAMFNFANKQLYSRSRFPPAQRWQFVEQRIAEAWFT